ncbi:coronin [Anaeramoeba flamelloides]|uniref:Coronin n=1 Tax=Anaeramoeba flamelloides TaxID=1746091 RepID=A0AAV7ZSY2_9EUKA|nr:coronin [Anaeramoeba flamelloides]
MTYRQGLKFRHVFGTASKPENSYQNVKISKSAWDSNWIAANNKYVGICWGTAGGGSFAVIPHETTGKLPSNYPRYTGHSGKVLDIAFNPFNTQLIASASEDCSIKIWQIPEEGLTEDINEAAQVLLGHNRKVGQIKFNPVANNLLASSSTDQTIRLWDIEKGEEKIKLEGIGGMPQSFDWSFDGSRIVCSAKDKKLRMFDPRAQTTAIQEVASHTGIKGSRICWLGSRNRFVTVGFSRSADRQLWFWDADNLEKPLIKKNIDTSSGVLMPFYDDDTNLLFLAGKGDGNIRYYEIINDSPYFAPLNDFASKNACKGACILPKVGVNVSKCEVVRMYRMLATSIQSVSFVAPRKADFFQEDLFPETRGMEPSIDVDQWLEGENTEPIKISLEGGFVAPEPKKKFVPEKKKQEDIVIESNNPEVLRTRLKQAKKIIEQQEKKIKDLEALLKTKN